MKKNAKEDILNAEQERRFNANYKEKIKKFQKQLNIHLHNIEKNFNEFV